MSDLESDQIDHEGQEEEQKEEEKPKKPAMALGKEMFSYLLLRYHFLTTNKKKLERLREEFILDMNYNF